MLLRPHKRGFLPIDIPDLVFWFDPNQLSTITKNGSNVISAARDLVGGFNFAPAPGDDPIWVPNAFGKSAGINYTKDSLFTSPFSLLSNTDDFTIFVSFRSIASTVNEVMFEMELAGVKNFSILKKGNGEVRIDLPSNNESGNVDVRDTNQFIRIEHIASTNTYKTYFKDNVVDLDFIDPEAWNSDTLILGAGSEAGGSSWKTNELGEYCFFKKALNASEKSNMSIYLKDRWSIV